MFLVLINAVNRYLIRLIKSLLDFPKTAFASCAAILYFKNDPESKNGKTTDTGGKMAEVEIDPELKDKK